MTKYKVGTPHRRKSRKAQCVFCKEWGQTLFNPDDYICSDCREFFKKEMSEAVENTHWAEDAYPGIKDRIIKAIEEAQPVASGISGNE